MSNPLADFMKSGKKLLEDTKLPKLAPAKNAKIPAVTGDPHKMFVRRTIQERPKKAEVVAELKKFISAAEEQL